MYLQYQSIPKNIFNYLKNLHWPQASAYGERKSACVVCSYWVPLPKPVPILHSICPGDSNLRPFTFTQVTLFRFMKTQNGYCHCWSESHLRRTKGKALSSVWHIYMYPHVILVQAEFTRGCIVVVHLTMPCIWYVAVICDMCFNAIFGSEYVADLWRVYREMIWRWQMTESSKGMPIRAPDVNSVQAIKRCSHSQIPVAWLLLI